MTDPEYTYVRGQGWAVRSAPPSVEIVDLRETPGPFRYQYQHRNEDIKPFWGCIKFGGRNMDYATLEEAIWTANNDEVARDAVKFGWSYRIAIVNT